MPQCILPNPIGKIDALCILLTSFSLALLYIPRSYTPVSWWVGRLLVLLVQGNVSFLPFDPLYSAVLNHAKNAVPITYIIFNFY